MKFEKDAKILIKGQTSEDTVSNAEEFGNLIGFYMGEDAKEYYEEILKSLDTNPSEEDTTVKTSYTSY